MIGGYCVAAVGAGWTGRGTDFIVALGCAVAAACGAGAACDAGVPPGRAVPSLCNIAC